MAGIKGEEQLDTKAEARTEMSGLEYMRKLAAGELPQSGMGRLMGFRITEVSEGYAVVTVVPDERHHNGIGIAHGGLAATLLDSATGCAINTMMPPGRIFTTLEMKINYVRPIRSDAGTVRCEARVIHAGSRTAYAEGRVVDERGRLYAHGTATCMLFRAK
ncbi:MAG TPA: PaaI family thioesterase [Pyrinomonadaceae bacterium]|nr:PaaI family thioesterase [Pyrinomonadaceae bacterium]